MNVATSSNAAEESALEPLRRAMERTGLLKGVSAVVNAQRATLRGVLADGISEKDFFAFSDRLFARFLNSGSQYEAVIEISKRFIPSAVDAPAFEAEYCLTISSLAEIEATAGMPAPSAQIAEQVSIGMYVCFATIDRMLTES
ncbi:MAG: hypothetical protein Q8O67_11165 [Deltaproteobacteria bacterium]|nr:hypothetical protein [Deltaproteobacteria bacterium]